ncbi:succinylglutamate desuccinylase, partial [Photobacterium sanctipauli]
GQWKTATGATCELLSRGVLQITPSAPTGEEKSLVLSSGVHGDETSPIELIQRLAEQIICGQLAPSHRLLLIIAHPDAINNHTRFIEENMNRLFKGRNQARNIDCVIANQLQDAVSHFYSGGSASSHQRWHLDLHCAIRGSAHYTFAVSPHSDNPTRDEVLFAFLQQAKIEAAMLSNTPSSTFSWYSAENFSAQALTLELGRVAKFGENDLDKLAPFYQALLRLVSQPHIASQWQDGEMVIYKVTRTLIKHSDDFRFNFPNDQANFTFFAQGQFLAADQETEYFALDGGESVVFPNANVAIGQRACLLVKETEVSLGEQLKVKD